MEAGPEGERGDPSFAFRPCSFSPRLLFFLSLSGYSVFVSWLTTPPTTSPGGRHLVRLVLLSHKIERIMSVVMEDHGHVMIFS